MGRSNILRGQHFEIVKKIGVQNFVEIETLGRSKFGGFKSLGDGKNFWEGQHFDEVKTFGK